MSIMRIVEGSDGETMAEEVHIPSIAKSDAELEEMRLERAKQESEAAVMAALNPRPVKERNHMAEKNGQNEPDPRSQVISHSENAERQKQEAELEDAKREVENLQTTHDNITKVGGAEGVRVIATANAYQDDLEDVEGIEVQDQSAVPFTLRTGGGTFNAEGALKDEAERRLHLTETGDQYSESHATGVSSPAGGRVVDASVTEKVEDADKVEKADAKKAEQAGKASAKAAESKGKK
jgi:hypothetical protein